MILQVFVAFFKRMTVSPFLLLAIFFNVFAAEVKGENNGTPSPPSIPAILFEIVKQYRLFGPTDKVEPVQRDSAQVIQLRKSLTGSFNEFRHTLQMHICNPTDAKWMFDEKMCACASRMFDVNNAIVQFITSYLSDRQYRRVNMTRAKLANECSKVDWKYEDENCTDVRAFYNDDSHIFIHFPEKARREFMAFDGLPRRVCDERHVQSGQNENGASSNPAHLLLKLVKDHRLFGPASDAKPVPLDSAIVIQLRKSLRGAFKQFSSTIMMNKNVCNAKFSGYDEQLCACARSTLAANEAVVNFIGSYLSDRQYQNVSKTHEQLENECSRFDWAAEAKCASVRADYEFKPEAYNDDEKRNILALAGLPRCACDEWYIQTGTKDWVPVCDGKALETKKPFSIGSSTSETLAITESPSPSSSTFAVPKSSIATASAIIESSGSTIAPLATSPATFGPEAIKTYNISLDVHALDRWSEVAKDFAYLKNHSLLDPIQRDLKMLQESVVGRKQIEYATASIPPEMMEEIKGMASVSKMDTKLLTFVNLAYELDMGAGCLGILARMDDGNVLHGRTMEFGVFKDIMRNTSIFVNFKRAGAVHIRIFTNIKSKTSVDGTQTNTSDTRSPSALVNRSISKVIYSGVAFAFYVGMHTGHRANAFSVAINLRGKNEGDNNGIPVGQGQQLPVAFAIRQALEHNSTYESAVGFLTTVPLLGSAFLIVAGINTGTVLVKDLKFATQNNLTTNSKYIAVRNNLLLPTDAALKGDSEEKIVQNALSAVEHFTPEVLFKLMTNVTARPRILQDSAVFTVVMSPTQPRMLEDKQYMVRHYH